MGQLFDDIARLAYSVLNFIELNWLTMWGIVVGTICLVGMSPLRLKGDEDTKEVFLVGLRKAALAASILLILTPIFFVLTYATVSDKSNHNGLIDWYTYLLKRLIWMIPVAILALWIRFLSLRFVSPRLSLWRKKLTKEQQVDTQSDIREEAKKYTPKIFAPEKYYKNDAVFVGLNASDEPIYIPLATFLETNKQLIGPSRYGKGVIIGNFLDQAIWRGETVIYIDPKHDKFAPRIMEQACRKYGRKFIYLALHDDGPGSWSPFVGGNHRDALARLEVAFGLQFTGEPGPDYYKGQERKKIIPAFKKSRHLEALLDTLSEDEANVQSRITAELEMWKEVESLRPPPSQGFDMEQALRENAVVYVQGSLDDYVVQTATKVFIIEMIQAARRLNDERRTHLTAIIDEVSFLISKELTQALATMLGFRVNFTLAYQSQNDLLNLQDKTVSGAYVYNSINVNSQIKAIYGGADAETAKWISEISGTVVKEVERMAKIELNEAASETWGEGRTIGAVEEHLIHQNTVLTMPKRVCAFKQPDQLAEICFTAFVPVEDMTALDKHIEDLRKASPATAQPKPPQKKITSSPFD